MKRIKLKISPCPNDTFAFYAMLHSKVDTLGYHFDVEFLDIEELNRMLLGGKGDVVKASAALYRKALSGGYQLLDAGSALGFGNGPIVVRDASVNNNSKKVALPGENTTAARLFHKYFKGYQPLYVRFDRVADMVSSGGVELGVLIHEGRFTFSEMGLEKISDLGEEWDKEYGVALPLGGIYCREEFSNEELSAIIRSSVAYAMAHREEPMFFVRRYAQELSEEVLQNHISYFVNDYTLSLGREGISAFSAL